MPQTAPSAEFDTPTDIRLRLVENGYRPIPVKGKRPLIDGWAQIVATATSVRAWESEHADHRNSGILTGQVVAIDIDALDETVAARLVDRLLDLPDAGLAPCRVGRAPKSLYVFRAAHPRKKAKTAEYIVAGSKCQVEVLGVGQQFVAYGIHPETEQPYEWHGADLLSVPLADLPEISAEHLDEFLADAEEILAEVGTPARRPAERKAREFSGETFWTRVNSAALAAPERWVQRLFPSATQEAGTGAWRVTSRELGRSLEEDLSIHPEGIQDFGLERPETPISLVQQYGSASNAREAAHWLCERLSIDPKDLGWDAQPAPAVKSAANILENFKGKTAPVAANDNEPKPFSIFDWRSSRFVGEPDPPEYLVDGVVELGIPGLIAAMGEVGKSFTLLELHRRIAFGTSKLATPILGGQVVQEGSAVFITGEDDARSMHRRIAALDEKGARFAEKGDKLIVVPMPSAVRSIQPFWVDKKGELAETAAWRQLCDELCKIPDLRSVAIDPLQLFASLKINEDPAAGQFVCGSIAGLAAETGANVWFAHHMSKGGKDITTLGAARDAIRGTTAIVDGVRLAYALWYPEKAGAMKAAKAVGVTYEPNRIVYGGVVKANGAARRVLSTYARNDAGLLVDRTALLGGNAPDSGDLRSALVVAIEAAAASGSPFTKTGQSGLFEMRERLPDELAALSKKRIDELAEAALSRGEVVRASARGEKVAKWLDVPGGMFAIGLGEFRAGRATHYQTA